MQLQPKITFSYLAVVLIWSTTPLGIVWSSESIHPVLAVMLRMCLACVIGLLLLPILGIRLPVNKNALRLYGYSVIGVYGGMMFSYLAAGYIPSGLISVVFGLAPIIAGIAGQKILGDAPFSKVRWFALIVCLLGLAFIFRDALNNGHNNLIGILLVLIAVTLFSLSSVMVKTVEINIHPMATTVGAVTLSLPLYFISWYLMDGQLNYTQWSSRSVGAIVYLGLFGSLFGFICYYFILQKLAVSTVSLVTLITPVIALLLGNQLNGETLSKDLLLGTAAILLGLSLYLWGDHLGQRLVTSQNAL
ncbi:DMT family transporter [Catenovulum sediminis]|uniref:DMT family transporter n=1 Tax=Catenovulum sediminis TaxID=1740262 RepID=UPI00117FC1E0|nr:DMT family transporter [Catenovulum sediminis]